MASKPDFPDTRSCFRPFPETAPALSFSGTFPDGRPGRCSAALDPLQTFQLATVTRYRRLAHGQAEPQEPACSGRIDPNGQEIRGQLRASRRIDAVRTPAHTGIPEAPGGNPDSFALPRKRRATRGHANVEFTASY